MLNNWQNNREMRSMTRKDTHMGMLILLQALWAYFLTQKSPANHIQSTVKQRECPLQQIDSLRREGLQGSTSIYSFWILIWLKSQIKHCLIVYGEENVLPSHVSFLTSHTSHSQCRTKCQAFHVGVNAKQMFAFYQQSYRCPSHTQTWTTGCSALCQSNY